MTSQGKAAPVLPDDETFDNEARRILRRLCEPGALLAVAADLDKAVVVRETDRGGQTRLAVVDRATAQALALKDWIHCDRPARISRFRVTASGRSALSRLLAEHETRLRGFAETQAAFGTGAETETAMQAQAQDARTPGRYAYAESPLLALARRRGKDGQPFLPPTLVSAGERLREDFELAHLHHLPKAAVEQGLTEGAELPGTKGCSKARQRVTAALRDLGPGLADVAMACCCYLEGMEATERRLGWSARSGKIVLRIALQRLRQHYAQRALRGEDMIG